eukprot:746245-Hanusia_phi.AAC.1
MSEADPRLSAVTALVKLVKPSRTNRWGDAGGVKGRGEGGRERKRKRMRKRKNLGEIKVVSEQHLSVATLGGGGGGGGNMQPVLMTEVDFADSNSELEELLKR